MHPDVNNQLHYQETTEAALNTLTRMVIDMVCAFNRECGTVDTETLHPAIAHIIRCAQQHILTSEDFNDPMWLEDFDQIRKVLAYFNRRWALAGEFDAVCKCHLPQLNRNRDGVAPFEWDYWDVYGIKDVTQWSWKMNFNMFKRVERLMVCFINDFGKVASLQKKSQKYSENMTRYYVFLHRRKRWYCGAKETRTFYQSPQRFRFVKSWFHAIWRQFKFAANPYLGWAPRDSQKASMMRQVIPTGRIRKAEIQEGFHQRSFLGKDRRQRRHSKFPRRSWLQIQEGKSKRGEWYGEIGSVLVWVRSSSKWVGRLTRSSRSRRILMVKDGRCWLLITVTKERGVGDRIVM